MAAAEARAVWQRAVNRCFVQEDAKRAPKLACCQSSSAASTNVVDSGSSGDVDLPDHPAANFMPLNQSPRYLNLPPDARWWVHMKRNHVTQKGLNNEQIHPMEVDTEILKERFLNSTAKDNDNLLSKFEQDGINLEKCNFGVEEKELKGFERENVQEFLESMETRENYSFVGLDNVEIAASKKLTELSFDPGSHWSVSSEKTVPWWRTTDKDELASLVAQRSLNYIENCDLPTPQKKNVRKHPYGTLPFFDCEALSSWDQKSKTGYVTNADIHKHWRHRASAEGRHVQYGSEKSLSNSTHQKEITGTQADASESGLSKAELLEALRHSQTRAREAEAAAKEANTEKEHLIKLLFKQASQLFAYKQWFKLLQLETLFLQTKKKNESLLSTLPWMPCEARKTRKRGQNSTRVRRERSKPDVAKYAIAWALGLSLVGAGLLLGWTVGWMLPF